MSDSGIGLAQSSAAAMPDRSASSGVSGALLLAFCLLASLVAISNQSLWIDEALTAMKAQQPTVGDWWRAMLEEKGSDLQMPLYMLYIWGFVKIFGSSEWVLRAANLPLFLPGLIALAAIAGARRWHWHFLVLAAAVSPFCWSYLDEARPYAMQLGASFLIVAALARLSEPDAPDLKHGRLWAAVLGAGLAMLYGSSLLGAVWAITALAATGLVVPRRRLPGLWRNSRPIWLLLGLWAALLGCYYAWTLSVGARASAAAGTSMRNLAFAGYELLGLAGLGPGRLEIRESGFSAFSGHMLWVCLYALIALKVFVASLRVVRVGGWGRTALALGICLACAAAFLSLAGWAAHFRVLGRHFAPVAVAWLGLLGIGLAKLWAQRSLLTRLTVLGFFVLSLCSGLSLRFAARHQRDDYRGAAARARAALAVHHTVWWNADRQAAAYYRLLTTDDPHDPGKALWLANPSPTEIAALPVPDVVVASKPDLYDGQGALATYLQHGGFSRTTALPAFAVWARNGN